MVESKPFLLKGLVHVRTGALSEYTGLFETGFNADVLHQEDLVPLMKLLGAMVAGKGSPTAAGSTVPRDSPAETLDDSWTRRFLRKATSAELMEAIIETSAIAWVRSVFSIFFKDYKAQTELYDPLFNAIRGDSSGQFLSKSVEVLWDRSGTSLFELILAPTGHAFFRYNTEWTSMHLGPNALGKFVTRLRTFSSQVCILAVRAAWVPNDAWPN